MPETWLIGDTHFGYERVLNYTYPDGRFARPCRDVDEMTELLVENWNSVVKDGDTVIHMGDVMNTTPEKFDEIWRRLLGKKTLVVGNHDDIHFLARGGYFTSMHSEIKIRDMRLHLTHVPVHHSQHETGAPGSGKFFCNVHGHIHQLPTPEGKYINVSVEAINFTPINLDEVASMAKKLLDTE